MTTPFISEAKSARRHVHRWRLAKLIDVLARHTPPPAPAVPPGPHCSLCRSMSLTTTALESWCVDCCRYSPADARVPVQQPPVNPVAYERSPGGVDPPRPGVLLPPHRLVSPARPLATGLVSRPGPRLGPG